MKDYSTPMDNEVVDVKLTYAQLSIILEALGELKTQSPADEALAVKAYEVIGAACHDCGEAYVKKVKNASM